MKQERWRTKCKRRSNFVPFIQESVRSLEWQQKGEEGVGLTKIWGSWVLSLLSETLPTCVFPDLTSSRDHLQSGNFSVFATLLKEESSDQESMFGSSSLCHLIHSEAGEFTSHSHVGYSRYFSRNVPSGPEEKVEFFPRFHSIVQKTKFTEGWRNVNRQDTINYLTSRLCKSAFSSIRQS